MKSIDDALELRGRILGAFEQAERSNDPAAAREAADLHRRRRRSDRCRDGRADRRTGRPHPQGRVPAHRLDQGAGDPARRRARGAAADGREARPARRRRGWRRWASRSSSVRWSPTSTATASRSRTPTAPCGASNRPARCGRPECRPAHWAATSPSSRDVELDRAGRVKVLPDLSIPGYPNVFVVGDMAAVEGVPGMAQGAIQGGKYVANRDQGRTEGRRSRWSASRSNTSTRARWRRCRDSPRWPRSARWSSAASSPGWRGWCCTWSTSSGSRRKVTTLLSWTVTFLSRAAASSTITEQQAYARTRIEELEEIAASAEGEKAAS